MCIITRHGAYIVPYFTSSCISYHRPPLFIHSYSLLQHFEQSLQFDVFSHSALKFWTFTVPNYYQALVFVHFVVKSSQWWFWEKCVCDRHLRKNKTFYAKRLPSNAVMMNSDGGVDMLKIRSTIDHSDSTPGESPATVLPAPQVILSEELCELLRRKIHERPDKDEKARIDKERGWILYASWQMLINIQYCQKYFLVWCYGVCYNAIQLHNNLHLRDFQLDSWHWLWSVIRLARTFPESI